MGTTTTAPPPVPTGTVPQFGHVVLIVEENSSYSDVIGSSSMPYLNSLATQYGLATLDDPKHAIPPYDAIVLLAPKRANDGALVSALSPLIGQIGIARMRDANLAVSRDADQLSPVAAAGRLWREISGAASAPSG